MRLLITGGSGFLGKRIVSCYQGRHECIVPSHEHLDITDETGCMKALEAFAPDCVIHTAAVSNTGICEKYPEESYRINVAGTIHLAKACAAAGSRLIFMSSDQVYSGSNKTGPNCETDDCCPVNVYGRHKLEAEQRIREILADGIVLRLSWMYDHPASDPAQKSNFLSTIMDAVSHKNRISFSDQDYRGITYVKEVIRNLETVFCIPGGIYNFGSDSTESVCQLARQILAMLGADGQTDALLGIRADSKPRNLRMDRQRQDCLGICFSSNREGIRACLDDYL